jgi:plastocyanin
MNFQPTFKFAPGAALIVGMVAIAFTGCGGGGASSSLAGGSSGPGQAACTQYGGGGGGSGVGSCSSPTPTPTTAALTQAVGLDLTGESAVTTTSDGTVLGFFNGKNPDTPSGSGVVTLTADGNVQFFNLDSQPHTASFLGDFSGSYPSTFTNTNGPTSSPAGTVISTPNFSAGNINAGAVSAVYNTGGPGMYIFGCAYHYVAFGMRTVVIVS